MKKAMDADVVVMGLGYIGLPTAGLIASKGIRVHGADVNPSVVETINKGEIHIVEPDLEGLVSYVVKNGFLRADRKPVKAGVFLIAVPTPLKTGHRPDISYIESAVTSLAPYLKKGDLVIIESTSPVGTTEKVAGDIYSLRPELKGEISLAYCPERVLPGKILYELEQNDRVIGGLTEEAGEKARDFYSRFVKGNLHITNARTAEMCKLVENAYRDVNIAFANELSMICDNMGINVWELINLANKHPRVNILKPGPGVGGHCIAVDPWFIVNSVPDEARLIRTAREVNDSKPGYVAANVIKKAARFKDPAIACFGLSYKADIDDLRESPALEIVERLAKHRAGRILVVEPHLKALPDRLKALPKVELSTMDEGLKEADIVVILVDHRAFRNMDKMLLREKLLIDTRGL